jgi:exopolysaccharide biosynthesis polyprenyl glycosylphosphotransferase
MIPFLTNPIKKKQYLLMMGDSLIIFTAILAAYLIRSVVEGTPVATVQQRISWMIPVAVGLHLLVFHLFARYEVNQQRIPKRRVVILLAAVVVAWAGISILSFLVPEYKFGRIVLTLHIIIAAPALFFWRRRLFQYLVQQTTTPKNLLLVGSDRSNSILQHELSHRFNGEFNLIGLYSPTKNVELDPRTNRMGLEQVIRQGTIDSIIYSVNDNISDDRLIQLLEERFHGVNVQSLPQFYSRITGKIPVFAINASWMLSHVDVNPYLLSPLKRVIDLLLAIIGLLVTAPFLVIIGVAIILDSKGPILFEQERLGLHRKPFKVYKFRTMVPNAEAKSGPVWATKDDPRITRVGKILRKTRLDELPQFINILKGEMSVVGFRPIRQHFAEILSELNPFYTLRFMVKPGLTGWSQVMLDYPDTEEGQIEKLQYELFYLQNATPLLDIYIILKTITTVLLGQGQ